LPKTPYQRAVLPVEEPDLLLRLFTPAQKNPANFIFLPASGKCKQAATTTAGNTLECFQQNWIYRFWDKARANKG